MPDRPGHLATTSDVDTLNDLDGFLGLTLISTPDTRDGQPFEGVLKKATRPNGSPFYWLEAQDGSKKIISSLTTAQTLVEPTGLQGVTVGTGINPVSRSIGKQSEADLERLFGISSGSTAGRAPPAFSGTQAGIQFSNELAVAEAKRQEALAAGNLAEARKWEIERDRIQNAFTTAEREASQGFTAEQNALAEEAALKRNRLGVLSNLISDFMASQSQARDTLANLQPDPFRFAAVAGGVAPFGTTPQQGFQEQLQQFAGAAPPTIDPNATSASLQDAINQLQGSQAPQAPQVFGAGLAEGGTVPTPFQTMSARLVGEKGPEVMVTGPQGVTILPLGKGAQEGGFFPFQPIEFTKESLLPALTTSGIFNQFQGNIPRGTQLPDQSIAGFGGGVGHSQSFLENLGIRPSFISPFGRDEIFFRDPSGQLRLVTDTAGQGATSQIQPGSVTQVDPASFEAGQFGTLGSTAIGANELRDQLATVRPASPFTRPSAPIFEPTTGTLLPAPATVASQLNRLRLTNPFAFNLLLSAYQSAGVPGAAVLGTIQTALPFGAERGTIGLN